MFDGIDRRRFLKLLACGSLPFLFPGAFAAGQSSPAVAAASSVKLVSIGGRRYVRMNTLAAEFGLKPKWVVRSRRAKLASSIPSKFVEIEVDQKDAILNGTMVYLCAPVVYASGELFVGYIDYNRTLIPMLKPTAVGGTLPKAAHIVLDPGHGGNDSGALNVGKGLKEKVLTMDVATRLATLLRKRGLRVTMTRTTDKFVELADRAALANKLKADAFVSIHFNAAANKTVSGLETYIMTPKGESSTNSRGADTKSYAANLQDNWNALLGWNMHRNIKLGIASSDDRGLRRARFAVLHPLNCPGVLVECGYISNSAEADRLRKATHRQQIADSLDRGIAAYAESLKAIRAARA